MFFAFIILYYVKCRLTLLVIKKTKVISLDFPNFYRIQTNIWEVHLKSSAKQKDVVLYSDWYALYYYELQINDPYRKISVKSKISVPHPHPCPDCIRGSAKDGTAGGLSKNLWRKYICQIVETLKTIKVVRTWYWNIMVEL